MALFTDVEYLLISDTFLLPSKVRSSRESKEWGDTDPEIQTMGHYLYCQVQSSLA